MKVLHAEMARDAEAVRRFRTEAQAVSRLDHPNIVQTFDFGQWDDALYLVMEYLKGDDLSIVMKREGPLPFARAVRLFIQICSALTDAHEAGVIHRDLKPENIVVIPRRDGTETAKVLDFGLAKLRERTDVTADITSAKSGRRYALLHVARAGPLRAARRPHGHLQPGRDLVPGADGDAPLPGHHAGGGADQARDQSPGAAAHARAIPELAADRRRHPVARDGQGARGSLPDRRRHEAGSRGGAERPSRAAPPRSSGRASAASPARPSQSAATRAAANAPAVQVHDETEPAAAEPPHPTRPRYVLALVGGRGNRWRVRRR